MICEKNSPIPCPVRYTLDLIGGKWKIPIIANLQKQTLRFKELERIIGDISPRMLVKELKDLEEHGLVTRTLYAEVPPRVEYALTAAGRSLLPMVREIHLWGAQHMAARQLVPSVPD